MKVAALGGRAAACAGVPFLIVPPRPHSLRLCLQARVFFSAHGVPKSYVIEAGDPYKEEMVR